MNGSKIFLVAFLLMFASLSQAQISFIAKVSKERLGVNERLRVDFIMNKDGDNFSPPNFDDFTVLAGPSQSVNQSWVNGKRSYAKSYIYFLQPKSRGNFKIGQASVEIDGQIYKTSPIAITVTQATKVPSDPNNPDYVPEGKIHLIAEVSDSNPYLNEAISVTYKLYVSIDTGVETWREVDIPRYNDFWSQTIKIPNLKAENTRYNGEDYRFVVLRKVVLYPQKSGKLEIEPLTLDVSMKVPTNRRNFFGNRVMASTNKMVSAGSRTINVKPLPEANKPVDFSGAVGQFDFEVETNKMALEASESFEASVRVEGNGNLKLINLPKLTLPSALEVYEPEHSEDIRTNLNGMQGHIEDTYTVVPQYKGKYPIPQISFSYFDPVTESYKRLSSEEILIDVHTGPVGTGAKAGSVVANPKKEVELNDDQFAYIKTKTSLKTQDQDPFFRSGLFWGSIALPLLAIPLALMYRRRKEALEADVKGRKQRRADKLARKYLGEAKKNLGTKEAFYVSLERALHNYLKAKLLIETSEMSKDLIKNKLLNRQVSETTVNELRRILENCELARYTPFSNVEMRQDYERAAEVISKIDKEFR